MKKKIQRPVQTKQDILRLAVLLFFERGYSNTSARAICDALHISTGHLTFYYPTKEHILLALVEALCEHQQSMLDQKESDQRSPIYLYCLARASMLALCEENENIRDFFLNVYTRQKPLSIIREAANKTAEQIFRVHVPTWTEERFRETAALVCGMEYAALIQSDPSISLETRIKSLLDCSMAAYRISDRMRSAVIDQVLFADYKTLGKNTFADFTRSFMIAHHLIEEKNKKRRTS